MYKVTNKGKTLRYVAGVAVQPGQSVEIDEKFKARIDVKVNKALVESGELEIKSGGSKVETPVEAKEDTETKARAKK